MNAKELEALKDDIEQKILNNPRIVGNREIYEEAQSILFDASELMSGIQTKDELLFMYNELSVRLHEAGMVCKEMGNPDLAETLIIISKAIKDLLQDYLLFVPRNINKRALLSRLWPHSCQNIKKLKDILGEYIVGNAVLLRCNMSFVVSFFSKFRKKIFEADNIDLLRDVYRNIQYEAERTAIQRFARGDYEYSWKYGVVGLVIEYMFSDFDHCFGGYGYGSGLLNRK